MSVDLTPEIAAFERELPALLQRFESHRWVVFLDSKLQGDFATLDEAFDFAMREFPQRDFLIRDIRAEKLELPFLLLVA